MRGALLLAPWLLWGCSHAGPAVAPADEGPAVALLRQTVELRCAACHDAEDDLPLTGAALLQRADEAALLVAAGRMPPPPDGLSEPERQQTVRAFCLAKEPDAQGQSQCIGALLPQGKLPLLRTLPEYQRALEATAPLPRGAPQPSRPLVERYATPSTRSGFADPTREALRLLMAAERCAPLADAAARDACYGRALAPELSRITPPASAEGGR